MWDSISGLNEVRNTAIYSSLETKIQVEETTVSEVHGEHGRSQCCQKGCRRRIQRDIKGEGHGQDRLFL